MLARPRGLKGPQQQGHLALSSPPWRDRREGRRPAHAAPPQGKRTAGGRGRGDGLARENRDDGPLDEREVCGRAGGLGGDAQRPERRAASAAGEGTDLCVLGARAGEGRYCGAARQERAAVAGRTRVGRRWVVAAGRGALLGGWGGRGSGREMSVAKPEASERRGHQGLYSTAGSKGDGG